MQRNMDLVRVILMRMEDNTSGWAPRNLGMEGFSEREIGYHCHIMMQEGLIEGCDFTSTASVGLKEAMPTNLTWKGHEFLDLARDQDRWNQAKSIIARVGTAPIAVWMKVLTDHLSKSVETISAKLS